MLPEIYVILFVWPSRVFKGYVQPKEGHNFKILVVLSKIKADFITWLRHINGTLFCSLTDALVLSNILHP